MFYLIFWHVWIIIKMIDLAYITVQIYYKINKVTNYEKLKT